MCHTLLTKSPIQSAKLYYGCLRLAKNPYSCCRKELRVDRRSGSGTCQGNLVASRESFAWAASRIHLEVLHALLEFLYRLKQFGELLQRNLLASQTRELPRRGTPDELASGDVIHRARIGTDLSAIADVEVIDDTRLSAAHHVLAEFGRSGDPRQCGQEGSSTNVAVVGHHDKVVDLRAAPDYGHAAPGAVDCGVGPDLDAIFNNHCANFWDLEVLSPTLQVSKTICPDCRIRVDDDIVTNRDIFTNHDVGPQHAVPTGLELDEESLPQRIRRQTRGKRRTSGRRKAR